MVLNIAKENNILILKVPMYIIVQEIWNITQVTYMGEGDLLQ